MKKEKEVPAKTGNTLLFSTLKLGTVPVLLSSEQYQYRHITTHTTFDTSSILKQGILLKTPLEMKEEIKI